MSDRVNQNVNTKSIFVNDLLNDCNDMDIENPVIRAAYKKIKKHHKSLNHLKWKKEYKFIILKKIQKIVHFRMWDNKLKKFIKNYTYEIKVDKNGNDKHVYKNEVSKKIVCNVMLLKTASRKTHIIKYIVDKVIKKLYHNNDDLIFEKKENPQIKFEEKNLDKICISSSDEEEQEDSTDSKNVNLNDIFGGVEEFVKEPKPEYITMDDGSKTLSPESAEKNFNKKTWQEKHDYYSSLLGEEFDLLDDDEKANVIELKDSMNWLEKEVIENKLNKYLVKEDNQIETPKYDMTNFDWDKSEDNKEYEEIYDLI